MENGRKMELYLTDGTAEGVIEAEFDNWSGIAEKIPRLNIEANICPSYVVKTISKPGVYFLFCKADDFDDKDSVYIGESENVYARLLQHINDYQNKKEKFYWQTAIVFTEKGYDSDKVFSLDKGKIRYLEGKLCLITQQCNRYNLLTKKFSENEPLKRADEAGMERFIDNIRPVIGALGHNVLTPKDPREHTAQISLDLENNAAENENAAGDMNIQDDGVDVLYMKGKAFDASGMITSDGFVILKKSVISKETKKSCQPKPRETRDRILEKDGTVLSEDILCATPSFAAQVVRGSSTDGLKVWKNKFGKCLGDLFAETEESR